MKYILFYTLIVFGFTAKAAHIVGGDMYYDYLGGNQYRIYISIYRDCASTGAEYDNPMSLGIFDANNVMVSSVDVPFPGSTILPVIFENPCVTAPSGICTERAIYTTVITLPPSANGYTVAYQRCCRGDDVTNLANPGDTGLTLTVHITGTNSNALVNSSPRYVNYPPLVICNNETINFDHRATDPDGDSLSYELVTPFAGAGPGDPQPIPPPSPNYPFVNWVGGYSATAPLGSGSTTSINPITGLLYVDANLLGEYVVAIRVNEWRNGVLLSSTTRDFLFKVVNCVIQLSADITPQEELQTFTSYCQGRTIQFENESFGGTNYDWDFGVEESSTDISNQFEPTFTFPDTGTYVVQLIVNKGWSCTDTSTSIFIILEDLIVDYSVIDSICITNNSFDFDGSFTGPIGTTFSWDFGSHGTPTNATTLDVNGVVFDTSGYIPILLTGVYNQCTGTKLDSIFIFRIATINFGAPNELNCLPYFAQFTDSSLADSQLTYFWEFGDGGTSNLQNPSHIYTIVNDFDVQLTIIESEGCMDTLTLLKPDLISVTPSPTSQFDVSPTITDIYHTLFNFTDQSIDGDFIFYWFNDSVFKEERNPTFSYVEGGYHSIFQIAINEYGCRDTSYQTVYVIPETTVYIPNAFTPDGDGFNNVWFPVIYDVTDYECWIYDRWGEVIFYTTEPRKGWNGTLNGRDSQTGTYLYKVRFRDVQTQIFKEIVGHFNLLR